MKEIAEILSSIFGCVLATWWLVWLSKRANPQADIQNGRSVLVYSRLVRICGLGALLVSAFLVFVVSQASKDQKIIAWIIGSIFGCSGIAVLLEFLMVRIEYDDNNIYTYSPWRKRRVIPWQAIASYSYSEMNSWHVFKTTGYGRLRLSALLSGLGSFFDMLRHKCPKLRGVADKIGERQGGQT